MIDTRQVGPSSTRLARIKTILVVEDDPIIGELLVNAIEQETPYHARLTPNAYMALHSVLVDGWRPAMFLIDYRIPYLNGFQLYDQLHEQPGLKRIPALIISASFPFELEPDLVLRQIKLLRKPFLIDDFLHSIEGILKGGTRE